MSEAALMTRATDSATVIDLTRMKMALAMASAVRAMLDASEALGNATEALLAQLDQLKGDADLEPSLGSLHGTAASGARGNQVEWAAGDGGDLEDEHNGGEPPEDSEPSLGSIGDYGNVSQSHWAGGDCSGQDPEEQCEDEGAQRDDEGHVEAW
jgi:hypothetical protein